MTGASVCEQCKKASAQCSRTSSRSSTGKCPLMGKAVYVKADPSNQMCIVVPGASESSSGCGDGGGGNTIIAGPNQGGGISLRFPGNLQVCVPDFSKTSGRSGFGDPNRIQIMRNGRVKTGDGGIQVMPCEAKAGGGGGSGGVQISVSGKPAWRTRRRNFSVLLLANQVVDLASLVSLRHETGV